MVCKEDFGRLSCFSATFALHHPIAQHSNPPLLHLQDIRFSLAFFGNPIKRIIERLAVRPPVPPGVSVQYREVSVENVVYWLF
jgi:hypothetical protein